MTISTSLRKEVDDMRAFTNRSVGDNVAERWSRLELIGIDNVAFVVAELIIEISITRMLYDIHE